LEKIIGKAVEEMGEVLEVRIETEE